MDLVQFYNFLKINIKNMKPENITAEEIITTTENLDQAIEVVKRIIKFTHIKGMRKYYIQVYLILLTKKYLGFIYK